MATNIRVLQIMLNCAIQNLRETCMKKQG